jgi:hypothetical protein
MFLTVGEVTSNTYSLPCHYVLHIYTNTHTHTIKYFEFLLDSKPLETPLHKVETPLHKVTGFCYLGKLSVASYLLCGPHRHKRTLYSAYLENIKETVR